MKHARVTRGAPVNIALPSNLQWMKRAKCRRKGNKWFVLAGRVKPEEIQQVLDKYCNKCPVRPECLNYAINMEIELKYTTSMIWGGALPRERKNLRRTCQERPGCKTFFIRRWLRLKARPRDQVRLRTNPFPNE